MKKLFLLLSVLSSILITSCEKKEAAQKSTEAAVAVGNDTLKLLSPTNIKSSIKLTTQAQQGVKNWSFYQSLTAAVGSIQSSTLGELRLKLNSLNDLYITEEEANEATVSITPETVQTNAVNARLVAIETKVKVLNNSALLNNPDAIDISNKIGELHNAVQHLNLQLNEIFDTSFKDLLEEIKQENEQAASEKADELTPN